MDLDLILSNWGLILLSLTAPWFLFAVFSHVGDAVVEFIDEWLLREIDPDNDPEIDAPGRLILISGFFGIVTSTLVLILTFCTSYFGTLEITSVGIAYAVAAGMFEVLWLIPYFYALQHGGTINTTPLFQTVPIFSLLFGITIFAEIPTLFHLVGTIIIITGSFLLNYDKETKSYNKKTLGLMFLSSAIISAGYFLFKDASEITNFITALIANGIGMTLISTIIWLVWRPYRRQFNTFVASFNLRVFVLQFSNEVLYTSTAIANQLAIVLGPSVMAVSAIGAMHPFFTLCIGTFLALSGSQKHQAILRPNTLPLKVTAIIFIVTGALLLVN